MSVLPPIHILDKKLFAQTIKGNVMEVPKPHVHSAILHLNRDCILYAFLPKYVDTKTFKVSTKSINTFRFRVKINEGANKDEGIFTMNLV